MSLHCNPTRRAWQLVLDQLFPWRRSQRLQRRRTQPYCRLRLEALEDRLAPAANLEFTITAALSANGRAVTFHSTAVGLDSSVPYHIDLFASADTQFDSSDVRVAQKQVHGTDVKGRFSLGSVPFDILHPYLLVVADPDANPTNNVAPVAIATAFTVQDLSHFDPLGAKFNARRLPKSTNGAHSFPGVWMAMINQAVRPGWTPLTGPYAAFDSAAAGLSPTQGGLPNYELLYQVVGAAAAVSSKLPAFYQNPTKGSIAFIRQFLQAAIKTVEPLLAPPAQPIDLVAQPVLATRALLSVFDPVSYSLQATAANPDSVRAAEITIAARRLTTAAGVFDLGVTPLLVDKLAGIAMNFLRYRGEPIAGVNPPANLASDFQSALQTAADQIGLPGGVISGQVMSAGTPLQGTVVAAVLPDGTSYAATTGADGSYTIRSLTPGTYTLSAGAAPFVRSTIPGVTVALNGTVTGENFSLQFGGSITGTVSGPGGPIAGAVVSASAADGPGSSTLTAPDGSYTIAGLPSDVYAVSATASTLVESTVPNVSVTAPDVTAGIQLTLAQGGGIAGTLAFADSTPAAGVPIEVTGNGLSVPTATDAGGAFSVNRLPDGDYTITAQRSDLMTVTGRVTVVAGFTASKALTAVPRGNVRGTVTDSTTGNPLPHVYVAATDAQGVVTSTLTDATGAYQLAGLDAGTYQVAVGDEGTPGVAHASATLSVDNPTATLNLDVAVVGSIAGTVFQSDGVTPFAGAVVSLVTSGQDVLDVMTGSDGRYVIDLLTAGTYALRARARARVGANGADGAVFAGIDNLTVSGGTQLTGKNLTAGHETINGLIQDAATGMPIAGATVDISLDDSAVPFPLTAEVTTGADGHFTFAGAIPGSYHVSAAADGHASASRAVTVTAGTAADGSLTLPVGFTVTGSVQNAATGNTLGGAIVSLHNGQTSASVAVTDATGQFTLAGIADGTYTLIAQLGGYQTAVIANLHVQQDQTQDVALSAATTDVQGTVTAAGPVPLSGVVVTATDANGLELAQAATDANGGYDLTGLPPGTYTLVARAPGYRDSAPVSVTVAAGQPLTGEDFSLVPVALTEATATATAAPAAGISYIEFVHDPTSPEFDAHRQQLQATLVAARPQDDVYVQAKIRGENDNALAKANYSTLVQTYQSGKVQAALDAYRLGHDSASGAVQQALNAINKAAGGDVKEAVVGGSSQFLLAELEYQATAYNGDWDEKRQAIEYVLGGVLDRIIDNLYKYKVPDAGVHAGAIQALKGLLARRLDAITSVLLPYEIALKSYNAQVSLMSDEVEILKQDPNPGGGGGGGGGDHIIRHGAHDDRLRGDSGIDAFHGDVGLL